MTKVYSNVHQNQNNYNNVGHLLSVNIIIYVKIIYQLVSGSSIGVGKNTNAKF